MSDVTLTSAVRNNLLALQGTQKLVDRTQGRLSTGLKVGSAIDDPVAFFQAKALSDRAADFQGKKDAVDQGVSSLSAALQGITGVTTLVKQLKGLALNAQSASSQQIAGLVQQYNNLRNQLDNLAVDSQYQGLNLVAGSGQQLTVSFSNLTGSTLQVGSVDVRTGANGLNIAKAVTSNGGFQVSFQNSTGSNQGNDTVEVVYSGTATSLTSGAYTFSYGTSTITLTVYSANSSGITTNAGNSNAALTTTQTFTNGMTMGLRVNAITSNGVANATYGSYQNGNRFAIEFEGMETLSASFASGTDFSGAFINGLTGQTLNSGTYTFSLGGLTMTFTVVSAGSTTGTFQSTQTFLNGQNVGALAMGTAGNAGTSAAGFIVGSGGAGTFGTSLFTNNVGVTGQYYTTNTNLSTIYLATIAGGGSGQINNISGQTVLDANLSGTINNLVTQLDANLQTLRSHAQSLGTNVALLNTRLDFTKNYVDVLQGGAGKLTLADLNEEGANLLALQTRQQLGIQALSFAGQNEKSILSLFR